MAIQSRASETGERWVHHLGRFFPTIRQICWKFNGRLDRHGMTRDRRARKGGRKEGENDTEKEETVNPGQRNPQWNNHVMYTEGCFMYVDRASCVRA